MIGIGTGYLPVDFPLRFTCMFTPSTSWFELERFFYDKKLIYVLVVCCKNKYLSPL